MARPVKSKLCVDCGAPTHKAAQAKRCLECKRIFHNRTSSARAADYYQNDRAKFLARAKRNRAVRGEKMLRATQRWREAQGAALNARRRAQHAADPEPGRLRAKLHAARRRALKVGHVSAAEWREIQECFGHACAYCGDTKSALTIDHVEPVSRGGFNTYYNIVPACHACNSAKQARTLMFMAKRGYLGLQNAA